jgi:3-methyladenine DNA glycosylase AlkC
MAATKLKEILNQQQVEAMAEEFQNAHSGFDKAGFVRMASEGLEALELIARAWHIAEAMAAHLPKPFPRAARVLDKVLRTAALAPGNSSLRFLPHSYFIQKYGLDDFAAAMKVQRELTMRFTAEFSIRPYLERYPEQSYEVLLNWTKDENHHVRRLVSEGTRPRLPWAPRLATFQQDPAKSLRLLELLKDDPSEYVRRSVANHLGDLAKDHPERAVEVARQWAQDASRERLWIVKHGLRMLVKQGHRGALTVLGAGQRPHVKLTGACMTPAEVRLGDEVRWTCTLHSTGKQTQDLIVDYAVHYAKARGNSQRKVFKWKRLSLQPQQAVAIGARISLRDLTTRKHYPGEHGVELLVNGEVLPVGSFHVVS